MKNLLLIAFLIFATNLNAQELRYTITAPPGMGMAAQSLPTSIDTNHYYTHKEIRDLPEPETGWDTFYEHMDTLEYPAEAKKQQLQSLMTVAYRIDEKGAVDSVYIQSYSTSSKWKRCEPCETQIMSYFRHTKWTSGKVKGTPVKSKDELLIKYSIFNPLKREPENVIGW